MKASRDAQGSPVTKKPKLTWSVDFLGSRGLGPGTIRLLETIDRTGSISEAARELCMSYRRAWLLVAMNECFRDRVIDTRLGGSRERRATLTPLGKRLIERYRAIEIDALAATKRHLRELAVSFNGSKASAN